MADASWCPFCGSRKLKLEKKSVLDGFTGLDDRVERHTFSVRCNVCHARGPAFGGKVIPHFFTNRILGIEVEYPSWATTDEELKEKAVNAWNDRV